MGGQAQPHPPLVSIAKAIIALELLLSVGALVGGAMMFLVPDGSAFGMPLSMLAHSGFDSFRFPGLILIVVNGVLPLISAVAMARGLTWAPRSVMIVGVVLVGWIVVQVALLRSFFWPLHGTYVVLGVVLVALGLARQRASTR
jgi:hypothetical protein